MKRDNHSPGEACHDFNFKNLFIFAPVLPIGKVVAAQVGSAEDDRVVKDEDLGVLQSQCLIVTLRHQRFQCTAQQRRVVQRHAAGVLKVQSAHSGFRTSVNNMSVTFLSPSNFPSTVQELSPLTTLVPRQKSSNIFTLSSE